MYTPYAGAAGMLLHINDSSLVLCVCFIDRCLYFIFWPLCCLFFFDIRILMTPLVFSNSSFHNGKIEIIIYVVKFHSLTPLTVNFEM